jgi:hypothetical protein
MSLPSDISRNRWLIVIAAGAIMGWPVLMSLNGLELA